MEPKWRVHEHYVQQVLGLGSTICSGNKWYDPGDGVTRGRTSVFPLMADCKFTEAASFSLKAKVLGQWVDRAQECGKRFILPLRFWPKGAYGPRDYVVMPLDDFAELLEMARRV